jgi:hypothetical protein
MGVASRDRDPEKHLSELMRRDLGVDIPEANLRLFLLAHWERVSALAHAIHENGDENVRQDRSNALRKAIEGCVAS